MFPPLLPREIAFTTSVAFMDRQAFEYCVSYMKEFRLSYGVEHRFIKMIDDRQTLIKGLLEAYLNTRSCPRTLFAMFSYLFNFCVFRAVNGHLFRIRDG